MIKYAQFISTVSIGGEIASIDAYSHDKHHRLIEPEEKGSWLILHLGKRDEAGKFIRSGERRRIPITNVGYINECDDKKAGV